MMNCSEQQHHGLQNAYGQNWILMVTQITGVIKIKKQCDKKVEGES